MKVLASLIVELAPIFLVVWFWPNRRENSGRGVSLDCLGAAFLASAVCSYVGAEYFGLAVFGRRSVIAGEQATGAALFLAALGVALYLLHYVFRAARPLIRRLFPFTAKRLTKR